jgi:hypothetical protein
MLSEDQANAWSFFIGGHRMCFGNLVNELKQHGISVTESQIRWAIKTGKVSRPEMDASLRFKFSEQNVSEIVRHFKPQYAVTA